MRMDQSFVWVMWRRFWCLARMHNAPYFVRGNPAVSIRVDRSDQGDAIRMQATVQSVADEMQLTLPQGVKIELIRTRAQAIQDRLGLLVKNGLMGLVLVVALLFLFLSARTAFWVAAGIPAAMFAAVGLMYASGLTLNMVSLFGPDYHIGHCCG